MTKGLRVEINDREVTRFLARRLPKITNQEMNKSYRRAISEFAKEFDKAKLGPGGVFRVRRKVQIGKTPRGQPSIPKRMRKAGFVARLEGQQGLDRKQATIYTGNPLLLIRETGGVIEPKLSNRTGFLFVRGSFRGRGAAAKAQALEAKLNPRGDQRFKVGQGILRPIVAKVQQIRVPATLGFESSWRAFQPRAKFIVRQGLAEVQRRFALEGAKKFAPREEAASA